MGNAFGRCMRIGCEVYHGDDAEDECAPATPILLPKQAGQEESKTSFREMKPAAMEILPSPQAGVVRVKLIISTNQMAKMINQSFKKDDDLLESIVTSLLREKGINMPDKAAITSKKITTNSSSYSGSSWKPALESIPEVSR